jgi:hypothetical protein
MEPDDLYPIIADIGTSWMAAVRRGKPAHFGPRPVDYLAVPGIAPGAPNFSQAASTSNLPIRLPKMMAPAPMTVMGQQANNST